jgi:hypothetical protein
MLRLLIKNYYAGWEHDGLKIRYLEQPEKDGAKDGIYKDKEGNPIEPPNPLYTVSNSGVPKLGGWSKEGRKEFYKFQKEIIKHEANEESYARMLAADKDALARIRILYNCDARDAKRAARGKKGKIDFLAKEDDEESDIEVDDCLG